MSEQSYLSGPKKKLMYLLAKKIDLVDFIENETGHDFHRVGNQYRCSCPLHNERTPSFFAWQDQVDDVWAFKCYGCDRKGTIIDFCIYYFDLGQPIEALLLLAERSEIGDETDIVKILDSISVKVNNERRLDCVHYVASNSCHMLLRRFFKRKEIRDWIKGAYKVMNDSLVTGNIVTIEQVGQEAYKKLLQLQEKEII